VITIMGMRAQLVIPVLASILILGTLGLSQDAFSGLPPPLTADLSITKIDNPDPVTAGNQLTYTLRVILEGLSPDDAQNVVVLDTLPAGVTFISASGSGWTCNQADGVVTCTIDSIIVGPPPPDITITVTVNPDTVGTLTNTASVSSDTVHPDDSNNSGTEDTTSEPPPLDIVDMDIKPTSCPNPLNTKSKGVLPVAILGSAGLDVNDIDVSTILLEGVPPIRSAIEDVATPFGGDLVDELSCTTAGADGFDDLTLKFDRQAIIAAISPVSDGDVITLTLTGELNDSTPLSGEDNIIIRKKGN